MIAVEHLSFKYVGRKRPTLNDVSFEVGAGETLLVLGPSGCGKSTLALCLNGAIPHVVDGDLRGTVRIGGVSTREHPIGDLSRRVGLVFQDPEAQFCLLTVEEEVAFGLENLAVPRLEMGGRIDRALQTVGLTALKRERIDRLSGGQKQRLALAAVLAMDPGVLILDEPTSNLDPAGAEEVFDCLGQLRRTGRYTMVVVEHRLDHVMHLVDRALVFGPEGRVIAEGPPRQVLRERRSELDDYGIWVPQVSELAYRFADRGLPLEPFPITVDDAVEALRPVAATAYGNGAQAVGGGRPAGSVRLGGEETRAEGTGAGTRPPPPRYPGRGQAQGPNHPTTQPPAPTDGRVCSSGLSPRLLTSTSAGSSREAPAGAQQAAPLPAVAVRGLSYRYPTGRQALRGVDLTVATSDFCAIVGPNGAGKSTLAKHLIDVIRPPRGTVFLGGRDLRSLSGAELTRFVGYVFQNPEHQFVAPTVFDELAFSLRVRRLPPGEVDATVRAILADFGLDHLAPAHPFTLSHGEKRRLSVATMLILGQEVLVLDEPTFGQDRRNAAMLLAKLVDLNRAGRTIVTITHDMRLVAEYARSATVLVDGAVAAAGPARRIFEDPGLLARAGLVPPPLHELGARLDPGGRFRSLLTVEDYVDAFARSAPIGTERRGVGERP